jgi:hypothetical protein
VRSLLLATCAAYPDGDPDDRLLIAPLAEHGVEARFAAWDDPGVDWARAPVVLRSTWDYTLRRESFLSWIAAVPMVHNAAEIVRWNSDKVYLLELAAAGVPITPTTVVAPGAAAEFPDDVEIVVKPSVGAGSRGAGRFLPSAGAAAAEHAAGLHAAGRTVLVQPYLDQVDEAGETALVFVEGTFSHAIRKGPMLAGSTAHDLSEASGLFIEENISAREPSAAELAVGAQAISFVSERFGTAPLYARVDLLPTRTGPVVVELELTEPSLFLGHAEGAARRFAAAVAART